MKRANSFRCQLCEALGQNSIGFRKANGEPYIEAHHVMHVATKAVGSLAASNVMTLCANHHREVHYGGIVIVPHAVAFDVQISGQTVTVSRCIIPPKAAQNPNAVQIKAVEPSGLAGRMQAAPADLSTP